jgi:hypothetical protein
VTVRGLIRSRDCAPEVGRTADAPVKRHERCPGQFGDGDAAGVVARQVRAQLPDSPAEKIIWPVFNRKVEQIGMGLRCLVGAVHGSRWLPRDPHLKAEFDQQRDTAQDNEQRTDPRLARIDRCKSEITDLRTRLADRDREITDLKRFRDTAVSRLAAQYDDITALRTRLRAADRSKIRSLPSR